MPERPFQCTPTAWNRDPVLNAVSWEAEFLFRRIALESDRNWRIAVDAENMAHSVRCRAFETQRRYRAWTLPKVARGLNELMAAGIVRRLVQGDRCWIEVGEWLQYVKGSAAVLEPERAVQPELNLPAPLFALPPVGSEVRRQTSDVRHQNRGDPPSHSNERRLEREESKTINRARARNEEELIAALAEILPPSEMIKNGGGWRTWIRECKRAVENAIEDWKLRTPDQRFAIKNRPGWLTDRYQRARAEIENKGMAQRAANG
jgi:hypothetical protein